MPTVHVNYYHRLRQLTGRMSEPMHLDAGATIADLKTKVLCTYPDLLPLERSLLIARNNEYAVPATDLHEGDIIDVMPPVSGG
jgi:molybdopterin converting factor small subunit